MVGPSHKNPDTLGELDAGRAIITIEELCTHYEQRTSRVLPQTAKDLKEALAPLRRYGMARLIEAEEGDNQPFNIAIQPAIEALVNDAAVGRLGAYQGARANVRSQANEGDDHEAA